MNSPKDNERVKGFERAAVGRIGQYGIIENSFHWR